jgi:hypothetical protein
MADGFRVTALVLAVWFAVYGFVAFFTDLVGVL